MVDGGRLPLRFALITFIIAFGAHWATKSHRVIKEFMGSSIGLLWGCLRGVYKVLSRLCSSLRTLRSKQTLTLASAEPVRECIFQTSPKISRLVPVRNHSAEHYSEHRPNLNLDG